MGPGQVVKVSRPAQHLGKNEIGSEQEETTELELPEQCMNPQRQKLKIVEGFKPSIEEVDLIAKLEEILQQ
jgi:hypothetical protein